MIHIEQFNYELDNRDIEASKLDLIRMRDRQALDALTRRLMEIVQENPYPTVVQIQRDVWRDYGAYGPQTVVSHRMRTTQVRAMDVVIDKVRPIPMVEYRDRYITNTVEKIVTIEKPVSPTWWQRLKNGVADAWKDAEQLSGCGITKPEAV